MANYQLLKADIDAKVYENAHREITGEKLNSVLNAMVTTLGAEYQFAGVATPVTEPGTPDAKVFYIANGKGTYTNFSGLEVTEDDVVVLTWDSSWHKVSTGIASQAKLSELESEFATKQDIIPDIDTIRAGAALGASSLQKETDPSVPSWAKAATKPSYTPAEIGAASEDSLQSHENDNTRHITEIERTEWNAKQEALTLTVKDNGNIVIANIQGQSKEFMPATPSGDPMHYAYVAAGAEYNENTGFWKIGTIDDLTNDELRYMYSVRVPYINTYTDGAYSKVKSRTIFPLRMYGEPGAVLRWINVSVMFYNSSFIEIPQAARNIPIVMSGECKLIFANCKYLKYIRIPLQFNNAVNNINLFSSCSSLEEVLITTNSSLYFKDSLKLSIVSVLYMINNENATSPITITLHANVYNRCMANADILAALQAHTNVSLASA